MLVWDRSVAITRLSAALVRRSPQMALFPIMAGASSVALVAALFVPTVVVELLAQLNPVAIVLLQLPLLFVTWFGLAFVATFFNVCVVYTTKTQLAGEQPRFFATLWFAVTKVHLIAAWCVVSASVGMVLRGIEGIAERSGLVGQVFLYVLRVVLAAAWAIMTMFVIPSMVYRGHGPIAALRDSLATVKATWGEGIVRVYGVGLVGFVCALPFLLAGVGSVFAAQVWWLSLPLFLVAVGGLSVVIPVFNLLSTVWQTVLYDYATTRRVPEGVDDDVLETAFAPAW